MKSPITTTQKTSSRYLISQLLGDSIFAIIGIFFLSRVDTLRSQWRFDLVESAQVTAIVFFIVAFLSAIYHVMVSKTYVNVYADMIEGKGMQKVAMQSINLRFDQITGISTSRGFMNLEATGLNEFLVINTAAGNYKIITTSERTKEIIEFFNKAQGK